MKTVFATLLGCVLIGAAHAADSTSRITPEMQASLDAQKRVIAGWAASSVIVNAVKAQNQRGPLSGVTNRTWKGAKPNDTLIQSFEKNAAGIWLAKKLAASNGLYREAFLSAARGEKVAFASKPSSYIHAGTPKFDVPMSGMVWEGKPEFDKSSHSYAIQIATPVMGGGRPIGVLVVGVSMKMVQMMAKP